MIRVITCGWNVGAYIDACIASVKNQTFTDWSLTVMLDPSEDYSVSRAQKYESTKIHIVENKKQSLLMKNIYYGIYESNPKPDDIIVLLDADDRFYVKRSLQRIQRAYTNAKCLSTYGSMIVASTGKRHTTMGAYNPKEIVREARWRASHPKTFAFKVFDAIPQKYFKGQDGNWLETTSDMAIMFSILELVGIQKAKFIPDILYSYNDTNTLSVRKNKYKKQKENEKWIRSMTPLGRKF